MAQFGLGNKRKKAASFEELNEQAKAMQGGGAAGGMPDLKRMQEMMGGDAKMMEQMAGMGAQMQEAMEMLSKMSPEELEKQMADALKMMTDGDMLKSMMEHSDDILATLEQTGAVPPEELAKFKSDPAYFEQKMQESFEQMQGIFNDPEILKAATETMGGLSEIMKNPGLMDDMFKSMMGDFDDDEKIEEARLKILSDPEGAHPMLKEMFQSDEMQELLKDPVKWRESVKEGQGMLLGGAGGAAGVGEL